MIIRKEYAEINSLATLDVPKSPGVYIVYCPKTKFIKFGRAVEIGSRISGYKSMCFNGGGVVFMYKTLPKGMIKIAEKILLSIAAARLRHVDKEEYFLCDSEEDALVIFNACLDYLVSYYTPWQEFMEPIIDLVNSGDVGGLEDIFSGIRKTILAQKSKEHHSVLMSYKDKLL